MAILKDGIYEAEDLFYNDGGFIVKVSGGEMEFFRGAGSVNRLKQATTNPDAYYPDLDEVIQVPYGFTPERCEFDKSLVKTIFSAKTDDELKKRLSGIIRSLTGCSLFESVFIITFLSECGLRVMFQNNDEHIIKSGWMIPALSRLILKDPSYNKFRQSLSATLRRGDPEDIRLYDKLIATPRDLKPTWAWTEKDTEECLAVLRANPRFREYLAENAV